MKYTELNIEYQESVVNDLLISIEHREKSETCVYFLSKNDFSIINSVLIGDLVHLVSTIDNCLNFYHYQLNYYYKINIENFKCERIESDLTPEYLYVNGSIQFLDNSNKIYRIKSKGSETYLMFKPEKEYGHKWIKNGILKYSNAEKSNNWIVLMEPESRKEKWKIQLEWKITQIETFSSLILINYEKYDKLRSDKGYEGERDWYNPSKETLIINSSNGDIVKSLNFEFYKIDRESNVLLSYVTVTRLSNGYTNDSFFHIQSLINLKEEKRIDFKHSHNSVLYPMFQTDDSLYYKKHKGEIGQVDKVSGELNWEFIITDQNGKTYNVDTFRKLENQNIILRTTKTQQASISLIFNPKENLEFNNKLKYDT